MYVAVAWLAVQALDTLAPLFGVSEATSPVIVIVLAIGFVPVVIVSWLFELTPEGLKLEGELDHAAPTGRDSAKRLDRTITGTYTTIRPVLTAGPGPNGRCMCAKPSRRRWRSTLIKCRRRPILHACNSTQCRHGRVRLGLWYRGRMYLALGDLDNALGCFKEWAAANRTSGGSLVQPLGEAQRSRRHRDEYEQAKRNEFGIKFR